MIETREHSRSCLLKLLFTNPNPSLCRRRRHRRRRRPRRCSTLHSGGIGWGFTPPWPPECCSAGRCTERCTPGPRPPRLLARARRGRRSTSAGSTTGWDRAACPSGATPISTELGCLAAAKSIGVMYRGTEVSAAYPAGCYMYGGTNTVWLNTAVTGNANMGAWRRTWRPRRWQGATTTTARWWSSSSCGARRVEVG